MVKVIKKDGSREEWDSAKILNAIKLAADRAGIVEDCVPFSNITEVVYWKFKNEKEVTTSKIHEVVIKSLKDIPRLYEVGVCYRDYHTYKKTVAQDFNKLKQQADDVLHLGDRENANFDSSLTSTKGSIIKGYLTKMLYEKYYLSKKELSYIKRGDIYIHDLRDMLFNNINCCLFDIGSVLQGGFRMSNVKYSEPNSVLAALQVIGDITLVATAQQFGGFTLAELDKVLIPYCVKTYRAAYECAYSLLSDYIPADPHYIANREALKAVKRELEQGFQSLELKLNTVPCSRGDFAFTTITFGHLQDGDGILFQKMIIETILETRMKGHGGKQVVFPKLVYLFSQEQYNTSETAQELFRKAVECSSKCMYPDYLSIDGNASHNVVAQTFLEDGAITSPMGCRAYLSPWKDPETDTHVTIGRCNIGAVSLNLPVIMAYCKQSYGSFWKEHFYDELEDRLETIRRFLKKRYKAIADSPASSNPMAYTQGGLYNGYRSLDDKVGDLIQYMTASFGISALNEATILWTGGKSLHEDKSFATEVLKFINDKVAEYKKEDGHLYAIYGTPAESLCATQAKQYADYSGDTQFGEYFSNSFHLHVSEDVTPFEKQDEEEELFHQCNGGHIQYVRIDNPTNIKALKAVILRGMAKGFYQGVNFDAAYCEDCKQHSTNVMFECPHCGSKNLSVISRVCGYLGYSNINGKSRMNHGKMVEISERKSM